MSYDVMCKKIRSTFWVVTVIHKKTKEQAAFIGPLYTRRQRRYEIENFMYYFDLRKFKIEETRSTYMHPDYKAMDDNPVWCGMKPKRREY